MNNFLPVNKQDLIDRNISELDFIYISGDAYVDHPSFGHAIITRMIESQGYTVGIIPQPQSKSDYTALGTPKIAFLVGSGVCDSMVNNYTTAKRKRSDDVYSEGGKGGKRPDRALTVYCNNLRKYFDDATIIVGGIEASLRRFSHYDYWSDKVMKSVLVDCDADLLMYGMGENPLYDLLKYCDRNIPLKKIKNVQGTCYICDEEKLPKSDYILLPSHEDVKSDKVKYCKAFIAQNQNTDAINANVLVQYQGNGKYLVQNLPAKALSQKQMDAVYDLPFQRKYHPMYTAGVPAINEVEFSITSQRGCFGGCSFCAINFHQGRVIQNRSEENIVKEAKVLIEKENFKGYIHDVGGPSANFYERACPHQKEHGVCKNRQCIGKNVCPNLVVDHKKYVGILKSVRKLTGVKKVFVRSGIRFDYLMMDRDKTFFDELCQHHISGQLKIAPEHISDCVLNVMNKPKSEVYKSFSKRYNEKNKKLGKDQYLVPYFISSHPGSTLADAIKLAEYLNDIGFMPRQVQDFYPTPSTKSTCMYYTGLDPDTLKPIYVARNHEDKRMQRSLLQWRKNENYDIVKDALIKAKREDLIGYEKKCLIKPINYAKKYSNYSEKGRKPNSQNKFKRIKK